MLGIEGIPDPHAVAISWAPILYAGVLSSGVGYTLQIIGQKGLNPTVASLILSLESVISVLAGWLFLGQNMSCQRGDGLCVDVWGHRFGPTTRPQENAAQRRRKREKQPF